MSIAHAAILSALSILPTFHEDVELGSQRDEQLKVVATALAEEAPRYRRTWPGSTAELVAFAVAIAKHETHLSARIQAGRCKPLECDRGKARSYWQLHKNALTDEEWQRTVGLEQENVSFAARVALKRIVSSRNLCKLYEGSGPTLDEMTFNAYAGHGCLSRLKDGQARVATYRKVLARLQGWRPTS